MVGEERSLGEVARRLDEVFNRFDQVANDLPKTFVTKDLFEARIELLRAEHAKALVMHDEQEKRIAQLEDDKTWLYRLVIGAVILALIGLVIGATHATHGTKGLQQNQVMMR